MDTKTKRKFTGKLDNFESGRERNFQKKALKAYIKGKEYFIFGKDSQNLPIQHKTPQEVTLLENK